MAINLPLRATLMAIVLFATLMLWSSPSAALLYSKTGTPLKEEDFKIKLNKELIQSTDPLFVKTDSTSKKAFSKKWKKSLTADSVQFFRSYPPAYHQDLAQISPDKIPGEEGLCFGDAHPENFGFLNLDQEAVFAYNDLDDSGYCPIAYDALRFFTALRLWFGDDALTKDVLEKYVDLVKDPMQVSIKLPLLSPACDKKDLDKVPEGNQFDDSKDLEQLTTSDSRYANIWSAVIKDKHFANYQLLDIASRTKDDGGSGGLTRYWVLMEDKFKQRSIFELKEAPKPGVEYGRALRMLSMNERLPILKQTFWTDTSDNDYFYITLNGNRFLARNRLNMKGIKIGKHCEGNALKDLLFAEANRMAVVHTNYWNNVKKDDLRTWLRESSKTLSKRWQAVYEDYVLSGTT